MNVYKFNPVTKEYAGEETAFLDPLETKAQNPELWEHEPEEPEPQIDLEALEREGLIPRPVYLIPANATTTEPPEAKGGFARLWNGEAWEYVEDHRGVTVWKSYDESMVIVELGAIPDGWSETRPAPPPPPETKTVRTFSKFSIWVATHEMPLELEDGTQTTVWAAFEAFLNNAGLWTGWLQLVDLVEDNPFFEAFYPQAVEAFGKELVDGVLAASVTSTKEIIIEQ